MQPAAGTRQVTASLSRRPGALVLVPGYPPKNPGLVAAKADAAARKLAWVQQRPQRWKLLTMAWVQRRLGLLGKRKLLVPHRRPAVLDQPVLDTLLGLAVAAMRHYSSVCGLLGSGYTRGCTTGPVPGGTAGNVGN